MDDNKLMRHPYRFSDKRDVYEMKFRKLYGFILNQKKILSGYRGSIAHGLTIEPEKDVNYGIDDVDTFSIYCYPIEYYLSLESYYHRGEVHEKKEQEIDDVSYELRKTFHLLSGCNPNVMTYLYNSPEDYIDISEGGKLLLSKRDLFLGKRRIRDAYNGYAYSQLTRLQGGAYKGYMGDKRRKIVDKIGYDTKNAMTLIRLLRNGVELLETGVMQCKRTIDKDFLLDVKTGKYTLSEIQKIADEEFKKAEKAYEESKLPEENNKNQISELLIDIINIENGL